jgi:D-3-phosphoglycerate dehydrogenase
MPRVLVTTVPFGEASREPIDLLQAARIEYLLNPLGRRLKPDEVAQLISQGFDVVIAGTETIDADALRGAPGLKLIARVGIGLDSIDLVAARSFNIAVTYTPDGPSTAVAELAIALMLDRLRNVSGADRGLRAGHWNRFMGRRLSTCTVGIVGVGRIGKNVIRHLARGFPGVKILANDTAPDLEFGRQFGVEWVEKEQIYRWSDIVTLHIPLTPETKGLIGAHELGLMSREAVLINTARGGIVSEDELALALNERKIAGAAVDVFSDEPYSGPLAEIDNCVLTCHMGSMSRDCRTKMEMEATKEAVRFLEGLPPLSPAPESEYELAARVSR